MSNPVIIIVEGGCVQDVLNADGYILIDYDEMHYCPICAEELTDESLCPACNIDWEGPAIDDVLEARQRYLNQMTLRGLQEMERLK